MLKRKSLRYPILGAIGLLAGALPLLADYPTEVLNDGPLAYYRLNENITTAPKDYCTNIGSLGSAGNGVYAGVYSRPVEGAIAGDTAFAISNPGSTTYAWIGAVNVPNNAALNPNGAFTVEFWAKPAGTNSVLLSTVNSMSFDTASRAGYLFYQNSATWQFRVGNSNSATATALNGGTIVAGQWQHVVGVYSGGASGTMTLFVDGVQVNTGTASLFHPNGGYWPFCIGGTGAPNRSFNGTVDEVAFYSTALSPGTIAAHYSARTTNAAGYASQIMGDAAVGYWRLNEPAKVYPTAVNSGSLAATADAKYYGGVVNSAGPRSPTFPGFEANNSSGQFDGASGFVGSPLSLLNNRAKYTVMGWLKRGAVHSVRGGYFGQNDLLEFGDADNGVNVEAWVDAIGTNLKQAWPWADDQWGFICLTGDGQTNVLYMDGLAVQGKPSNVLNYGNNTWKFNIGGGGIFNTGGDFFNGNVDEVAMFDKALSPGRILTLYCIASGAAYAPIIYSEPPVASPSNTVYATTTFSLIPDIGGSQPMTFQWQKDGINIPGATTTGIQ